MIILNFTNIDPQSATQKILKCQSVSDLHNLEVLSEARIGQLNVAIQAAETEFNRVKLKADKRLTIALLELVRKRIKALNDHGRRLDHNFRSKAKEILPAKTYNKILEQAKPQ